MRLRIRSNQAAGLPSVICRFGFLFLALAATAAPATAAAREYRLGPRPGWVKPIAADDAAAVPVEQVSQGVYYLLSDVQVRVAGKSKTSYNHFAVKAVNEAGVEEVAHVEILFDPSYQVLTLHSINVRRGKSVMARLKASAVKVLQREKELEYRIYDGSKTANVFLEDVRVGDIVEYDYSVSGANPAFGGRHSGQFELQWRVPVGRAYNRLLWPKQRNLYLAPRNTTLKPGVRTVNGYTEYVWDVPVPAALVVERDAPAWYDPYASVQWSEFKDWASVAHWAAPLYRVPSNPGRHVQQQIDRIARASADPHERLLAALRFVQQEIRYLGVEIGSGSHAPRHPGVVLDRRFGDCKDKALLTVTMLLRLGIEADPALVNTMVKQGIRDLHPTPLAFNHVIVHARLDDRDFWIDPTRPVQNGDLAHLHQPNYGYALVIDKATSALSSMDGHPRNVRRFIHAVMDSRAGMVQPVAFTVTSVFEGGSADGIRNTIASENREELQNQYLNYYAKYYPGLTVKTPFTVAEDEASNRVTITEQYVIPDFWQRNEEKKRKQATIYVPDVKDWFRMPEATVRRAPLGLAYPYEMQQTTEVLLPEPWNIQGSKTVVDDPAFEFARTISEKDNVLRLEDQYRARADHVAPEDTARYVANLERAQNSVAYALYKNDAAVSLSFMDRINWSVTAAGFLFVLPMIWLALRLYRYDPAKPTLPVDGQLQGIGGWLILPAFGITLSPIRIGVNFVNILPSFSADTWSALTTGGSATYHPLWAPLLLFELCANLAQLAFALVLVVLFFQKRRSVPYVYIAFFGSTSILHALDLALSRQLPTVAAAVSPSDLTALTGAIAATVIWGSYFMTSKRVKATFVNGYGVR